MHATAQNQHFPQQRHRCKNQEGVWGEAGPFAQNPRGRPFAEFTPATLKKGCAMGALASRVMNLSTLQTLPPGEPHGGGSTTYPCGTAGARKSLSSSLIDLSPYRQPSWKRGGQTRALEPPWPSQPSPCGSPPSKDLSPSLARLQLSPRCPRTGQWYHFSCTVKVVQYKRHVFIVVLKPNSN